MAISQNAILAKFQSTKSLLLLHFSINLSETFRIDVNMDFANNLQAEFYLIFEPKQMGDNIRPSVSDNLSQLKRFG